MDFALLLPVLLVIVAALLLWANRRQRDQLHIPAGQTVYRDTHEQPGELLISHQHHLKGRPDFLLRQGGQIIPVEAKTGRTPATPYHSHVMQLMAYCLLVEQRYGIRPPHGVIRYPQAQFTVEFTPEREKDLLEVLAEMHLQRRLADVHRQHNHPKVCAACDYRDRCDERLAEQMNLFS